MRKALIGALLELAERDPRTVFLTADLGYLFVEPFAQRFPDRFFNVGVAEQNMVGVATGLAEAGFIPYVYSIATFAALRPYEFIRNGPVLQRLPVRIIGVGGGFEYDHAGPTHYALEDVGALRMLPGLKVVAPADAAQCRSAVLALHDDAAPAYFRLGKDDVYRVPGLDGRFEPGRLHVVREGGDALFLALGPAVRSALAAADQLAERGVASTVAAISSVSPAPEADLISLMSRFPFAVTVEGHYATGGLGSLACEVAAENGLACRITRCGVTDSPTGAQGRQEFMNHLHGISPARIAEAAWKRLREAPSPRRSAGDWAPARGAHRSKAVAPPLGNSEDT
ncbi:MAG: 1-deoxy-D-xylulose-5-phosphate synthase [Fibrobacteres bacterium]|nr:1-deoxy-D-xylulose-5-phosphate synthase [Fibrobacterota bacterium]